MDNLINQNILIELENKNNILTEEENQYYKDYK